MQNASHVLADALWPSENANPVLRWSVFAVLGSLLIAICAQIKVPMLPAPMTMQTFAVLLIGVAFGWRLGAATVALYLAEGFAGLPVFASAGAGPAYFTGPTAGYLVGFLCAAALAGWIVERGRTRSIPRALVATLIGAALILLLGALWLAFGLGIGVERAIAGGVAPFVLGDVVKAVLAALCLPAGWHIARLFHR